MREHGGDKLGKSQVYATSESSPFPLMNWQLDPDPSVVNCFCISYLYAAFTFGFAFLNLEYRKTPSRAKPVPTGNERIISDTRISESKLLEIADKIGITKGIYRWNWSSEEENRRYDDHHSFDRVRNRMGHRWYSSQ